MTDTPARDALDAEGHQWYFDEGDIPDFILANRSLVLAALVEQAPLTDDELKVARGLPPVVPDPRCSHTFPLPYWAGEDQMDPCRCRLDTGHEGEHWCEHMDTLDPRPEEASP